MNSTRRRRQRKQKRILGAIKAAVCLVSLSLVVLVFHMITNAVVPEADGEAPASSLEDTIVTDAEKPMAQVDENGKLVICLDAGHGGKDAGAQSGSRMEKDDTLALTLAIAEYLETQDVEVILTRSDDSYPTLSQRCKTANDGNADYFVSIHRNTGDGEGVETWIYSNANGETTSLADSIMDGLKQVGIQRNRGVKKGSQESANSDYYLNINTVMPACIVELGFLNNKTDNNYFDENQEAYAKAIGDAILATYQTYHPAEVSADTEDSSGDPSQPGNTSENGGDDTGDTSTTVSRTPNTMIENIASLDTSTQDWGPGVDSDDLNRPYSALSYQEKYAKYNANFIVPDTQGQKLIYLTMDEGYEYGCTPDILKTLKEKQVSAVFFITKSYAKSEPELVQQMIDEGHVLGNHSVTHPSKGLPSQTIEEQQEEVMGNHNYILENFNYEMNLFRYPAGKFSEQSLAIINNCNYQSVFWSFAYLDYDVNNQPDPQAALDKIMSRLHPGAIYLLHAESTTNTAILGEFIDKVRAEGYEFAVFGS